MEWSIVSNAADRSNITNIAIQTHRWPASGRFALVEELSQSSGESDMQIGTPPRARSVSGELQAAWPRSSLLV